MYGAPPRPTNARKLAESGSREAGLLFHKGGGTGMCGGEYLECLRLEYMRKHTRKQHERVSIFNIHGPVVEWRAAVSIAEHLTLRPSRFQVGCSRGAILTDPPKLRITLRCLLEVLRNETTARRGGPGSFDGVEEGCSGLKSVAEASHGSRGASRCVSITRLGKDGPRRVARLLRCVYAPMHLFVIKSL